MMAEANVPTCYTLTRLTRDAGLERRAIVGGFDVPYRQIILFGVAALISFPFTLLVWDVFGSASLVVPFVFYAVAYFLWERRTRTGLERRRAEAMWDKYTSREDVFYCRGAMVDPSVARFGVMVTSWAPAANRPSDRRPAVRPYPVLVDPNAQLRGRTDPLPTPDPSMLFWPPGRTATGRARRASHSVRRKKDSS